MMLVVDLISVQDYNGGLGIIRYNVPKVAANNSFGILRNLTSDNQGCKRDV